MNTPSGRGTGIIPVSVPTQMHISLLIPFDLARACPTKGLPEPLSCALSDWVFLD